MITLSKEIKIQNQRRSQKGNQKTSKMKNKKREDKDNNQARLLKQQVPKTKSLSSKKNRQ